MEIEISKEKDFTIYIDFVKDEGDPSRVFKSMSGLIDAFSELDQQLIGIFGKESATELVLSGVESGSIKSKLRSIIIDLPDEALGNFETKKIIGHFLLKAKYALLKWSEEHEEIKSIEQIREIEGELVELAEETGIKHLPAYFPIEKKQLLSQINTIHNSLSVLDERDVIRYESEVGDIELSKKIGVSPSLVREILTREVLKSTGVRIVKVKKPDYLGKSKWGLKYSGHSIEAAMEDLNWLHAFQNNKELLQPGDSLKVIMQEEVSYGYNSEVVQTNYSIIEVIEVIHPKHQEQVPLSF
jgi:hypothetical protein